MDVGTLYHHRSVECFADRGNDVGSDQWQGPIPCPGWTVRDLTGAGGTVQVSFGETPKAEYAMQLAARPPGARRRPGGVHGADTRMDPHLVRRSPTGSPTARSSTAPAA
jgi:hypothetical protein